MEEQTKPNEKSNLTLSVDDNILTEIKDEAKKLGISINSKVGKILSEYVLFGNYIKEHKPVIVDQPLFKFLVDGIDENILLEAWRKITIPQITPQMLMMHNITFTMENFVKYSFTDIGIRVGAFEATSYTFDDAGNMNLLVRHNFGIKWSKCIATSYSEYIQKTFGKLVSTEITPELVKMKISA